MGYVKKLSLFLGIDMFFVGFSIFSAYFIRFGGGIREYYLQQCIAYGLISICVCTICMFLFRLYNRIWQYASISEMIAIFQAICASSAISYLLTFTVTGYRVPTTVVVLSFETMFMMMGGARFGWRLWQRGLFYGKKKVLPRALIIGAGDSGALVAKKLLHNRNAHLEPVAFIDDNVDKHKQEVCGLIVLGDRSKIVEVTHTYEIDEIILAIPSASKKDFMAVLDQCKLTKAKLKIIPKIDDLIDGKVSINEIRNIELDDLLGREPIKVDLKGIANYVEDKTVLVTGAGGSIGSELCRQISPFRPTRLLLLGHGENSIYAIEMELRRIFPGLIIESIIADIQDRKRMESVFRKYRPQVVFHAAAHKHVPLMENNTSEAIKNNVLGSKNVADCADLYGSERFVLISTDKAVNPTSVMGATKRVAEMYIQSLNNHSGTKFVAVRFGNVLGSRGSVIPRFKDQIARGGPVTVTHPDMIRYFMTIPEAAQLVIQAGAMVEGGEIFILDMGKPVRIVTLAEDLIRLSGFEPYTEIDIEFTGIRPGEKLYEELLTNEEGITATKHNRIFIGQPVNINPMEVDFSIKKLERVVGEEQDEIKEVLRHIVPTYQNVG
ncbi:MAG: polysaccharide biosynthesis protein [Bacilli bacterium]|nr:polysaccharide biosynthesis protein [Bacilli bacterium]